MRAHTLGEVGILGTILLRVSSGTILPIFIEIGSYLTDKEQQIGWHSFFWDTRGVDCSNVVLYPVQLVDTVLEEQVHHTGHLEAGRETS